jgi:hypothetical protein
LITFSVIAYKEKYHNLTLKLLETFKTYANDHRMIVITDDPAFYEGHSAENIIVVQGVPCEGHYKTSLAYQCLEEALKVANSGDVLVLLDADCFFTEKFDAEVFESIGYGLTAQLGNEKMFKPSQMDNKAIANKILSLDPNVEQDYYVFREAVLFFRVDDSIHAFLEAWKQILAELIERRQPCSGQTFDMQVAINRTGYTLNNLGKSRIIEMFKMTDIRGSLGFPLTRRNPIDFKSINCQNVFKARDS